MEVRIGNEVPTDDVNQLERSSHLYGTRLEDMGHDGILQFVGVRHRVFEFGFVWRQTHADAPTRTVNVLDSGQSSALRQILPHLTMTCDDRVR